MSHNLPKERDGRKVSSAFKFSPNYKSNLLLFY